MAQKAGSQKKKISSKTSQQIRIRIQAYDHRVLDMSVKRIIDTMLRFNVKILGPIPLPTNIKKYTVNRSTFVFKDSREQLEMRMHKRVFDMIDPSKEAIDALTNLDLPSGVDIQVKVLHSK